MDPFLGHGLALTLWPSYPISPCISLELSRFAGWPRIEYHGLAPIFFEMLVDMGLHQIRHGAVQVSESLP
jgi:hypothetical protein